MSVHDIYCYLSQLISWGTIPPIPPAGVCPLFSYVSVFHQKLLRLQGTCTAAASGLLLVLPTHECTRLHGEQRRAVVQEVKAPG